MDPRSNQHQLSLSGKTGERTLLYTASGKMSRGKLLLKNGDPYRIRTDVNGVRGRCLNHLTNGPSSKKLAPFRSSFAGTPYPLLPSPPSSKICGFLMSQRRKTGTKGRETLEGFSLNQVYPLDTPSSDWCTFTDSNRGPTD